MKTAMFLTAMLCVVCAIVSAAHGRPAQVPAVNPAEIPAERYITVRDGHLFADGKRQRFWGVIGKVHGSANVTPEDSAADRAAKVEKARKTTVALLDRIQMLGFNSVRLWAGFNEPTDYTPGDGSPADDVDHFLKLAAERGMRIWLAGMNDVGVATPADAGVVDEPATAAEWAAAIASVEGGKMGIRNNLARIWDPRIEALGIRRMTAVATHLNRHTGLRWCDDPIFGVWELSNEEWWMRRMLSGEWQKLPPFFRNQLISRWNAHLTKKYLDDAALTAAWGKLLPGETLRGGAVLFAPMAGKSRASTLINDANPLAKAALQGLAQEYDRSDFSPARAADVIEFLLDLQLTHKLKEAAAIKPLGRSTTLSPMIFDTGIGYEIHSQYLHQHADAVAHCAYVNGRGPAFAEAAKAVAEQPNEQQRLRVLQEAERVSANSLDIGNPGPIDTTTGWINWLRKPPGISQGVPWLEQGKVPGKPFLCYETQIQQPAKYRTDYPLRIAALASIQDWDWVCWHYFGDGALDSITTEPRPWDKPMDITTGWHPQGYHFTYDEVQSAAMRAAAHLFRSGGLLPAPTPTTFVFGRKALLDVDSMDYGGSFGMAGLDMLQTAYQYGSRLVIDPTRADDEVRGPVVSFADRNTHNPYAPTPEIIFDWKKGHLKIDSPFAAAFTGTPGQIAEFPASAVRLSDLTITDPPSTAEPVAAERFVAFSLYSTDGNPLCTARTASLLLVSTSFNSGFALDEKGWAKNGGSTPVLVSRVGATIQSPALTGMRYQFLDWNLMPLGDGVVSDGTLRIPAELPVFLVNLSR